MHAANGDRDIFPLHIKSIFIPITNYKSHNRLPAIQIISHMENDIQQFEIIFIMLRNGIIADSRTKYIPRNCPGTVTIAAMIYGCDIGGSSFGRFCLVCYSWHALSNFAAKVQLFFEIRKRNNKKVQIADTYYPQFLLVLNLSARRIFATNCPNFNLRHGQRR